MKGKVKKSKTVSDSDFKNALIKKALGYDAVEVVEEPEVAEPVKPAKTVKTTGTKEARLSPREKFERRLAKTKEMQEQQAQKQ